VQKDHRKQRKKMKEEQIKKHLNSIINDLTMNVLDTSLRDLIKNYAFFAGGCFKSLIYDEAVNDYDLYFISKDAATKFLKGCEESKKSTFPAFDNTNLNLECITDNAVTLKLNDKTIQFIHRSFGDPESVVGQFDFYHCMNYYNPKLNEYQLFGQEFIDSKQLVYNKNNTQPVSSLKRMIKFTRQGMTISDEELLKIAKSIAACDLNNKKVLQKQLDGFHGSKGNNNVLKNQSVTLNNQVGWATLTPPPRTFLQRVREFFY
jgi:hypothetical protein